MRSYEMRFISSEALSQALELLMDSDCVASCMAEPEARRVWFLAPSECADALVQRIYLDGGLTWCRRHRSGSCDELSHPMRIPPREPESL